MDSHSNYSPDSDSFSGIEPQMALQSPPDLSIRSSPVQEQKAEEAQVENQFLGSNIAALESDASMQFPTDSNMPLMHQAIMKGWVSRLVGLIDKTNILVRTGILSMIVDQALRREQDPQNKEEDAPVIDDQTAAIIQKIDLAFQKENLIRSLIHLNSQRQMQRAQSTPPVEKFLPPHLSPEFIPEQHQEDNLKKRTEVVQADDQDRRPTAPQPEELERQVRMARQAHYQSQAPATNQAQDSDLNNKNSAFHFSVVSHKGRQLQFLLSQIPDQGKLLIYAKAKRETPFTKNRSPNTSMLRGVFKRGGLFRCLFKKNGIIKKDLGYYKTDVEAARAYDYEEIRTSGIKVSFRSESRRTVISHTASESYHKF